MSSSVLKKIVSGCFTHYGMGKEGRNGEGGLTLRCS